MRSRALSPLSSLIPGKRLKFSLVYFFVLVFLRNVQGIVIAAFSWDGWIHTHKMMCVRSSGSENSCVVPKNAWVPVKASPPQIKMPPWAYSMFELDLRGRRQNVKGALQQMMCRMLLHWIIGVVTRFLLNSRGNIYLRVAVNAVAGSSALVTMETGFGWCGIYTLWALDGLVWVSAPLLLSVNEYLYRKADTGMVFFWCCSWVMLWHEMQIFFLCIQMRINVSKLWHRDNWHTDHFYLSLVFSLR